MKQLIILFSIVFLAEIATDIYVPVLPLFISIFNADIDQIQLTMSLHLVGFALAQPVYGLISDSYGRRNVLLVGFVLFLITTLLCAFSSNIQTLVLFRFLQGIGACAAPVLGMAIIKDHQEVTTGAVKMLSLMSMTVSLSPIIGPILGTFTAQYFGWSGSFYLIFLLGAMLFPKLYKELDESLPKKNQETIQVCSSKKLFVGFLLIDALAVSCVWLFITAAPFILMQKYNVELLHYGYYQAFTVLAYMAGGAIVNRFIDTQGERKLITCGLWIIVLGAFMLLSVWLFEMINDLYFVVCVAIMNCGIGIFRPPMINRIMDCYPGQSGFAAGAIGTTEMSVGALAITTLGLFNLSILETVVMLYPVITLNALIIFYLLKPKHSMRVPTNA